MSKQLTMWCVVGKRKLYRHTLAKRKKDAKKEMIRMMLFYPHSISDCEVSKIWDSAFRPYGYTCRKVRVTIEEVKH